MRHRVLFSIFKTLGDTYQKFNVPEFKIVVI